MNMEIGTVLTISAMISFASYWAIKQSIASLFDKSLERYRDELEKSRFEHSLRFSKLYERQFEILIELYVDMCNLERHMHELTSPYQGPGWTDSKLADKARESFSGCQMKLEASMIFLSEDLYNEIRESLDTCKDVLVEMTKAQLAAKDYHSAESGHDMWIRAREKAEGDMVLKRKMFARSVRELFGTTVVLSVNDHLEKSAV
jgi:hypothetical protein